MPSTPYRSRMVLSASNSTGAPSASPTAPPSRQPRKRLERGTQPAPGTLPLGSEARATLERAQAVASRMTESHVEAPQILVGVLGVESGPVPEVPDGLDADRPRITEGLTGLVTSGDWTPSPWDKGRPNIEQAGLARCAALPEEPDALCGRGLFPIHSCFDDVRWSARGNRVQVALRRQ